MGWQDCHLHAFRFKEPLTGVTIEIGIPPENDFADSDRTLPGWRIPVLAYLGNCVDVMDYEYDFGDGWRHRIELIGIAPQPVGQNLPKCIAGARACPPEDCGGPWGYKNLLEAISDPNHEEHSEILSWIGGSFDPESFDASKLRFDDPKSVGTEPLEKVTRTKPESREKPPDGLSPQHGGVGQQ